MFENLFGDLLTVGIILYIALAIYMHNRGVGLSDVIKEIREGFRK